MAKRTRVDKETQRLANELADKRGNSMDRCVSDSLKFFGKVADRLERQVESQLPDDEDGDQTDIGEPS